MIRPSILMGKSNDVIFISITLSSKKKYLMLMPGIIFIRVCFRSLERFL